MDKSGRVSLLRIAPVRPTPSWSGLIRAASAALAPPPDPLATALNGLVGDRPVLGFSSGRAALYAAIRLALEITGRRAVILPAFTSFSVAAAATRAGASIRLVDLDPATLDFDPEKLDEAADGAVAALVLGNLFGFPSGSRWIAQLAERGIWVIDDAAQAFGAREHGAWVGTRGRLGVLSFGRGKCVTTGDGGALVLGSPEEAERVGRWRERSSSRGVKLALMAAGLKVAAGPRLFTVISRLPGLGVGESRFDPDFPIGDLAAAARGLAVDVVHRGLVLKEERRSAGDRWRRVLSRLPWRGPPDVPGLEPAFLRWPLVVQDQPTCEEATLVLSRVGFPFVRSYPIALNHLSEIRDRLAPQAPMSGAERLARCLLALPCHKDVTWGRVRLAAEALARVAMGRNADS